MSYAKRIGYLIKRDDLTLEQFHEHWLGTHAELCKKLPGLRRYTTNLIDRDSGATRGRTQLRQIPVWRYRYRNPAHLALIC